MGQQFKGVLAGWHMGGRCGLRWETLCSCCRLRSAGSLKDQDQDACTAVRLVCSYPSCARESQTCVRQSMCNSKDYNWATGGLR